MLVVSAVAALALGGCGENEIDAGKVEDFVRDNARVPQAIDSVTCPEGIEVEEGDTFDCKIVAKDGSEEAVSLLQEDDDGTVTITGNRQTKLPPQAEDVEIIPENVEALIRGAAEEPDKIVSVDCPSGIGLQEGRKFDCVVRYTTGSEEIVEIVQRDDLGNVEIAGSREGESG